MNSYELKDVDQQLSVSDYDFILTVYTPMGPEFHAVDGLTLTDEMYQGYAVTHPEADGDDMIESVCFFSADLSFSMTDRAHYHKLSTEDRIARGLEETASRARFQKDATAIAEDINPPTPDWK